MFLAKANFHDVWRDVIMTSWFDYKLLSQNCRTFYFCVHRHRNSWNSSRNTEVIVKKKVARFYFINGCSVADASQRHAGCWTIVLAAEKSCVWWTDLHGGQSVSPVWIALACLTVCAHNSSRAPRSNHDAAVVAVALIISVHALSNNSSSGEKSTM